MNSPDDAREEGLAVCVATSSFPRREGDLAGHFILQEIRSLPSSR